MNLPWPDMATVARCLYLPVLFQEGQRGREATVKLKSKEILHNQKG